MLAGAAAAAIAFDPERDLWVPGKNKIFVPKPQPIVIPQHPNCRCVVKAVSSDGQVITFETPVPVGVGVITVVFPPHLMPSQVVSVQVLY